MKIFFAIYSIWFINMNKNAYLLSSMAGVGKAICYQAALEIIDRKVRVRYSLAF